MNLALDLSRVIRADGIVIERPDPKGRKDHVPNLGGRVRAVVLLGENFEERVPPGIDLG